MAGESCPLWLGHPARAHWGVPDPVAVTGDESARRRAYTAAFATLRLRIEQLTPTERATHPPRILLLYGSLRTRSYSKLLVLEAARLLEAMGAETRVFDPAGLPLPNAEPDTHPKVQELRQLAQWAEGMMCLPTWWTVTASARNPPPSIPPASPCDPSNR